MIQKKKKKMYLKMVKRHRFLVTEKKLKFVDLSLC